MVLNVHRGHKVYWGRGEGWPEGGMDVGEEALLVSAHLSTEMIHIMTHAVATPPHPHTP